MNTFILVILLLINLYYLTNNYVLSNFCTITKTLINRNTIITMTPTSYTTKKVYSKISYNNYIKDIILCTSPITASKCDHIYIDDEHYCSLLCDRGFRIHILTSTVDLLDCNTLDIHDMNRDMSNIDVIFKKLSINPKSTAIIGQELSVIALLRSLPEVRIISLYTHLLIRTNTY